MYHIYTICIIVNIYIHIYKLDVFYNFSKNIATLCFLFISAFEIQLSKFSFPIYRYLKPTSQLRRIIGRIILEELQYFKISSLLVCKF